MNMIDISRIGGWLSVVPFLSSLTLLVARLGLADDIDAPLAVHNLAAGA